MKEIIERIESIAKELKEYDEWPYKGARDVCWYCGGKLVWQNDFSVEDVYGEGEGGHRHIPAVLGVRRQGAVRAQR